MIMPAAIMNNNGPRASERVMRDGWRRASKEIGRHTEPARSLSLVAITLACHRRRDATTSKVCRPTGQPACNHLRADDCNCRPNRFSLVVVVVVSRRVELLASSLIRFKRCQKFGSVWFDLIQGGNVRRQRQRRGRKQISAYCCCCCCRRRVDFVVVVVVVQNHRVTLARLVVERSERWRWRRSSSRKVKERVMSRSKLKCT